MSPLLILIPLGGALAYYLWSASKATGPSPAPRHQPAPRPSGAPPAVRSGGARATSYINQLNTALGIYRTAKLGAAALNLPGVSSAAVSGALKELSGTVDVVSGMAQNDLAAGNITADDKANIDATIAAIRAEMDGK